jgi:hypothetical protein
MLQRLQSLSSLKNVFALCALLVISACQALPDEEKPATHNPPKFESQVSPNPPANTLEEQVVFSIHGAGSPMENRASI